jgi:hypothetical protein
MSFLSSPEPICGEDNMPSRVNEMPARKTP